MDGSRFDEITRNLARGTTRRGLLGTALAGLAALAGSGAAAAPTCRDAGHPCEGNQTCCDGLVCVVSGPGNARRCAVAPTTTTTTTTTTTPAPTSTTTTTTTATSTTTAACLPISAPCLTGPQCCSGICEFYGEGVFCLPV